MAVKPDTISKSIGQRIRKARKECGMSVEELSEIIKKSPSTVSKYENGNIVLDVETLFDIAYALETNPGRFIDTPYDAPGRKLPQAAHPVGNPFATSRLYVYHYDGRVNRIVRSLLVMLQSESGDETEVTFYLNVPSFSDFNQCQFYYKGKMHISDTMIHFMLENPFNKSGKVTICAVNPYFLQHRDGTIQASEAVMLGFSFDPFGPFAVKLLLSKIVQPEDSELTSSLHISKDELKKLKKYNLFMT